MGGSYLTPEIRRRTAGPTRPVPQITATITAWTVRTKAHDAEESAGRGQRLPPTGCSAQIARRPGCLHMQVTYLPTSVRWEGRTAPISTPEPSTLVMSLAGVLVLLGHDRIPTVQISRFSELKTERPARERDAVAGDGATPREPSSGLSGMCSSLLHNSPGPGFRGRTDRLTSPCWSQIKGMAHDGFQGGGPDGAPGRYNRPDPSGS